MYKLIENWTSTKKSTQITHEADNKKALVIFFMLVLALKYWFSLSALWSVQKSPFFYRSLYHQYH